MELLIIPYMAVMSSLAGGSFPYSNLLDKVKLAWLPEVFFALGVALAATMPFFAPWWLSGSVFMVSLVWSYLWMQTGHADALDWDYDDGKQRDNTLTPVVMFFANLLGVPRNSEGYAWLFMAVKGFLITLPIGGLGIILWPLAYEIGSHARGRVSFDPHRVTELTAGGLVGLNCVLYLGVF